MTVGTLGQREKVLLGVLALLAPFAIWQYAKPALMSFASGGPRALASVSGVPQSREARQQIVELRLAALEQSGGEYEPDRNIFRYGRKRLPPPPPPPPPPPRTVRRTPTPPPPPAARRPPSLDLKLIGIFGPEDRRIAVLTDGKDWFQNALEEEVIHEKFIVHKIGYESVDFKFVGFPDVEPERLEIGG